MIDPFTGPQRNVIETDIGYEFGRGRVANSREHHIWGSNADIGATLEDFGAVPAVPLLAAASAMEIISSDVDDDGSPADTGARTVRLIGLDADWNYQTEVLTMNGTTAVISAVTWLRISGAIVESVGSTGAPEGTITIRVSVAGATHLIIPAGTLHSSQCHYTVPAGKEALIVDWGVGAGHSAVGVVTQSFLSATIRPDVRPIVKSTNGLWIPLDGLMSEGNTIARNPKSGFLLPQMCDIKVEGYKFAGTGTLCAGGWITVLEYTIITD